MILRHFFIMGVFVAMTSLHSLADKPIAMNTKQLSVTSLNPAYLDLLVPGYGMFSQREYVWGSVYASLKITGGVLIFFAVKNYAYWNSAWVSARNRQAREPDPLLFSDPRNNGDYLTAQEIQNKSDAAFLNIIYASLFEAAFYAVSFWHSDRVFRSGIEKGKIFYRVKKDGEDNDVAGRTELGWQTEF